MHRKMLFLPGQNDSNVFTVVPMQESGPCTVGDEESDPELMRYLGAKLVKQLGNNLYVS